MMRVWRLTSVAYIGPKSRTERPSKTKIGTEVAHVTRDLDTTFKVKKVKGQGHQAALVGCSSHYIIYMDDTIFYTPPPRASRCLSTLGRGNSVAASSTACYYHVFTFLCFFLNFNLTIFKFMMNAASQRPNILWITTVCAAHRNSNAIKFVCNVAYRRRRIWWRWW